MWIRLDDQITHHKKFCRVGPVSSWLFVGGLAYSARYLTDGFIPTEVLTTLTNIPKPKRYADLLVGVGLWAQEPEGWRIHDYHTYQPTKTEVERRREQRRDAGRMGGRRTVDARLEQANGQATRLAVATTFATSTDRPTVVANRNPVPVPVPVPEE